MAKIDDKPLDLAGKTCLVLTDAFPPFAMGGAELSLAASLRALPLVEREKLCVLSFADEIDRIRVSSVDSILVVHAPMPLAWPHNHLSPQAAARALTRRGLLNRLRGRLERELRSTLSPHRSNQRLAYGASAFRPAGGILTDYLLTRSDQRVRTALELASAMRLERLVCDNTRSILIGALVLDAQSPRPASIAIVRDNRFHCARPAQNRIVNGSICKTCRFQCAREDIDPAGIPLREESLRRTQAFRQACLNKFDRVIVTSHELARHVGQKLRSEIALSRIPNGLEDLSVIDGWTEGIAQTPQSDLAIIGMLNENKGQLQFLEAAVGWLRDNPDVRINLLGRGKRIESRIRQLAQDHGIENQILLHGYRSRRDIFQHIARARLVLAPTVWPEPFGRVPLEAGAARRAIVAFATGGLNESIIDGRTGLLVQPGDYAAFLGAVTSLLDDPAWRLSLQAAARGWIERTYSRNRTRDVFADTVFRPARSNAPSGAALPAKPVVPAAGSS